MDINNLEYVLTIAEEKSLLKASEKLFITPSALSQSISKLEGTMHTTLFLRSRQGWTLTPAGAVYVDMARDVIARRRKAYTEISRLSKEFASHLTVGITMGLGAYMFAQIFPEFHSKFPYLKIKLIEGTVSTLSDGVSRGSIDIAFLTSGVENEDLEIVELIREDFLISVPKTHPLASLAAQNAAEGLVPISLSRFRDDEFMLMSPGTTLRAAQDEMFRRSGFTPKVSYEAPSNLSIVKLAQKGFGISLIPRHQVEYTDQAVYFAPEDSVSWSMTAAYLRTEKLSLAEESLIALAKEYYHRLPFVKA